MYECFHCGAKAVVLVGDYDFSEFGYYGDGIVHRCTCTNCGADIEYRVPINTEDDGCASCSVIPTE